MRTLRICADDYALDPAVDAACLDLLAAGRLTAVSCMTLSPRWPAAAARLRGAAGEKGLHFDLTHPWAGRNRSFSLGGLLWRSALRLVDRAWVATEIRRQLDQFEAALGRAPDFVDGHQHVHQLPGVREIVLAEMQRRYGAAPGRPWVRSTWSSQGARGLKDRVLHFLGGPRFRGLVQAAGFTCNADFVGVYAFDLAADGYRRQLEGWLGACRDDALLMCHPALEMVAGDPIAPARIVEYGVLRAPDFPELLRRHDIRLPLPPA